MPNPPPPPRSARNCPFVRPPPLPLPPLSFLSYSGARRFLRSLFRLSFGLIGTLLPRSHVHVRFQASLQGWCSVRCDLVRAPFRVHGLIGCVARNSRRCRPSLDVAGCDGALADTVRLQIHEHLPPGITVASANDLKEWQMDIRVLDDNPLYKGEAYRLKFKFSDLYPIGRLSPILRLLDRH
jgi:hypothetical protein